MNLAVLKGIIASVPGWIVEGFADPYAALTRCHDRAFDLILVDYQMPGLDGIEVIRRLRVIPHAAQVPVVMITADGERRIRIEAIRAGANDFLSKPVDPEELRARAANLLALRRAQLALEDRAIHLADEVAAATRTIAQREEEVILRLARTMEYRDDCTGEHILHVAGISRLIAQALGLPGSYCASIYLAAQLHDTGKVGLPDSILLKPGALTPDEVAVMRRHTILGGEVLKDGSSDVVRMAHDIALSHHERWDGQGYPSGLAGAAIPLSARIVAVADVHDALRSERPYKHAWDGPRARAEIDRLSALAFDPDCVAAFGRVWGKVDALYVNPSEERAA